MHVRCTRSIGEVAAASQSDTAWAVTDGDEPEDAHLSSSSTGTSRCQLRGRQRQSTLVALRNKVGFLVAENHMLRQQLQEALALVTNISQAEGSDELERRMEVLRKSLIIHALDEAKAGEPVHFAAQAAVLATSGVLCQTKLSVHKEAGLAKHHDVSSCV